MQSYYTVRPTLLCNELPHRFQFRRGLLGDPRPLRKDAAVVIALEGLELGDGLGSKQDLQDGEHLHHRIFLLSQPLVTLLQLGLHLLLGTTGRHRLQ
jgi:hypothetical protein